MLIDTINSLDLGWKADTCKYQKHHEKYGSHCDKPQTLAQTGNSESENQKGKGQEESEAEAPFGKQKNFQHAWKVAKKFQKYASAEDIPDSELPANFDWRNVEGIDWTNEHRNQGHCGSCYTVSFT